MNVITNFNQAECMVKSYLCDFYNGRTCLINHIGMLRNILDFEFTFKFTFGIRMVKIITDYGLFSIPWPINARKGYTVGFYFATTPFRKKNPQPIFANLCFSVISPKQK